MKYTDVVWNLQFGPGLVPSRAIKDENGVASRFYLGGDLGQMFVHGLNIDVWHDERGTGVACRANGAEDVGRGVARVFWAARSRSLVGPDIAQCALLSDTGFVLPPQFQRFALGLLRKRAGDQRGKVFLCASRASPSWLGC